MKTVTLANDLNVIGYGTLPKGLKLNVTRFNSRYIYADLNGCELQLTYKDITTKKPKRKQTTKTNHIKDKFINDFLNGKEVATNET